VLWDVEFWENLGGCGVSVMRKFFFAIYSGEGIMDAFDSVTGNERAYLLKNTAIHNYLKASRK
jgi:hypothetical protein